MCSVTRTSGLNEGGPLRVFARSPLAWIVLIVGIVHAVGLGWGLPGSDGWDTDGVAPRDFLPGLADTFTPGKFYTYPPLHLAVLAILTLPVTLVAVVRAPSLSIQAVVGEIVKVPYMTSMSAVARVVALAMSLGIVVAIARLAEEIRAAELDLAPRSTRWFRSQYDDARVKRAGLCAAVVVGTNASLTYYGKTSNLDVPYLFWATWSLVLLARAMRGHRSFRAGFVLAALAIATKDQAYAMFVLAIPPLIAVVLYRDRTRTRDVVVAALVALLVLLVIDAAPFNPSGFRARRAFLSGPASEDYAEYTNDWSGRARVLIDSGYLFRLQYPVLLVPLMLVGLRRARSLVGVLPLLVLVSFTIAFELTARRTEARFLWPQAVMLAIYGGAGLETLVFAERRGLRIAGQALASIVVARALAGPISVDVNMIRDPRYDAARWLAANVAPGDTVEVYGLNVYLPQLPPQARVIRVGPEPLEGRNPLPGVEEVQAPYELSASRPTKWIVLPWGWAWRVYEYRDLPPGQKMQSSIARFREETTRRYFHELADQVLAFEFAHGSEYDPRVFPVIDVHGTTGKTIWIFKRR